MYYKFYQNSIGHPSYDDCTGRVVCGVYSSRWAGHSIHKALGILCNAGMGRLRVLQKPPGRHMVVQCTP